MHLDGDAFFVSVELVKNPKFRGKPVVTGQERGIASALSYEAKALGVTRTMPIFQIRRDFPQVAVLSSDYESYAIFSRRMMDIVKRYVHKVDEYSIDECFADFTHVAEFHKDPLGLLSRIKADIRKELGITVSLGLGPTKVIAKTASKMNKPNGLTILSPEDVPSVLSKTPIDKVWGIGPSTAWELRKKGVSTALEFASKPPAWVEEHFSKPQCEMWYELNCISVYGIGVHAEKQKSIMKTRSFVPASQDKEYVFSQLSKNIENACRRARDLGLVAQGFSIYLKTKDFTYARESVRLMVPSNSQFDVLKEARVAFEQAFVLDAFYRSTGVTLYGLVSKDMKQEDLFSAVVEDAKKDQIWNAVDSLNRKYGRNLLRLASSDRAFYREEREDGVTSVVRGASRKLSIPFLGEV
jgi:DNA polymerase-4/DNA polymerase V